MVSAYVVFIMEHRGGGDGGEMGFAGLHNHLTLSQLMVDWDECAGKIIAHCMCEVIQDCILLMTS